MKTITELRKERDLTQFELAIQVGVTLGAIYDWESGRKIPGSLRLRRLAEILGVSMDEIVLIKRSRNGNGGQR